MLRRRGARVAEILIIDDHPGDRYIMAEALKGAGHQVRQAKDGAEGLALCRERLPTLVVTDIVMAAKDGIETIRELRRVAPSIPILAVSGTWSTRPYTANTAISLAQMPRSPNPSASTNWFAGGKLAEAPEAFAAVVANLRDFLLPLVEGP